MADTNDAYEPVSPLTHSFHETCRSYSADFVDLEIIEPHLELQNFGKTDGSFPDHAYIDDALPAEYFVPETTWMTTAARWGPLLGLASLIFVFLSVPAAATVLSVSDGQLVSRWKVKPSVYLAVITGIGNKLLAFAAFHGAIITWWLRALDGTTMRDLHMSWSAGPGFNLWSPLMMIRSTDLLAIGTICAALISADGVLLQSATTVVQKAVNETVPLHVVLAPELPINFTGTAVASRNLDMNYGNLSMGFSAVFEGYTSGMPIPSPVKGCPGTCITTLMAAGVYKIKCTTVKPALVDLDRFRDNSSFTPGPCSNDSCPLFEIDVGSARKNYGSRESVHVSVGTNGVEYATNDNYQYHNTTCEYVAGIAEYMVLLSNDTTVGILNQTMVRPANNTRWPGNLTDGDLVNTTLGGIADLASIYISTYVGIDRENLLTEVSWFASRFVNNAQDYLTKTTGIIWRSPWDAIEQTLQELMFRASVQAAKYMSPQDILAVIDQGLQVTSDTSGLWIDELPTYRTRWKYYVFAAMLDLSCVLLVALLYRGYWKLGRAMSLNPLEIAKAFDAPLLQSMPSNMNGRQMADAAGDLPIRYGAVNVEQRGDDHEQFARRLIFHDPTMVYRPLNTFNFRA